MKTKIGIGVIGTGFARRTQIPAFVAIESAEVRSVSSGSLGNAVATAEEFGIAHSSDDWHETILREDVDLVCITTPPNLHLEMTSFALENGKHVLCEKPMAINADEAKRMTRMAENANLMAIIDHELRFTKGRIKAFEMIREGAIGKIRHAKYHFRNASRGDADLPWTWWSDSEQGGGALGAIASHVIDTFRWFASTEITEVFCSLHTHVKERPSDRGSIPVTTDDETMMILKLGDGELLDDATASASISLVEAGPYRNRVDFFGTDGAIRIEDGGEIFTAEIDGNKWESVEAHLGGIAPGMAEGGWSRGFTVLATKIAEALLEGKTYVEHAATFQDGLTIQRVLDAARQSDREKRTIKVT